MKTKYLFLLLVLLSGISANAQFRKYTFGLRAAPQIYWMKPNTEKYEGNGVKLGFSWGFVGEYNYTPNYSFSTGFNLLFNGGKLKFPATVSSDTGTMARTYYLKSIEIPLTLKMRTNPIDNIRYYGQIGLGTAFRFDARNSDEFVHGNTTVTTGKATYSNTSFLRESLIIGLGAEYIMKAGTILSTGVAFNNGFTDMLTGKNSSNPSVRENATSSFVELNVAVLF